MASAVVLTAKGGIFRIENAHMVTQDHIFGTMGGESYHYEVQDGDTIRFN